MIDVMLNKNLFGDVNVEPQIQKKSFLVKLIYLVGIFFAILFCFIFYSVLRNKVLSHGFKPVNLYSCDNNTKIILELAVYLNPLEGSSANYRFVLDQNKEKSDLYYSNNFVPVTQVNTGALVKVFELPDQNYKIDRFFDNSGYNLINLSIPNTVSEGSFNKIAGCFELNKERINMDLLELKNKIPKETKGTFVVGKLGSLTGEALHENSKSENDNLINEKLRNFESVFKSEYYILNGDGVIMITSEGVIRDISGTYMGDLFRGVQFLHDSSLMDTHGRIIATGTEVLKYFKNKEGENIVTFIKKAQENLGVTVSSTSEIKITK